MAREEVESEVTGTVWKIETKVGDKVAEGDVLMIIESMKMEIPVLATEAGTIAEFQVEEAEPADEPAMILCAMYLLQMCVNGDVDAARLLLGNGAESTRPVAPLQVRRRPPPRSGTGRRASRG